MHHVARVEQGAVVKADSGTEMKDIGASVRRDLPPGGQRWPDLRVGTEASETVEEIGHRATGRNIGGERRVERLWIVAITCVDERATMRDFTATARGEREQRDEGDEHVRRA